MSTKIIYESKENTEIFEQISDVSFMTHTNDVFKTYSMQSLEWRLISMWVLFSISANKSYQRPIMSYSI